VAEERKEGKDAWGRFILQASFRRSLVMLVANVVQRSTVFFPLSVGACAASEFVNYSHSLSELPVLRTIT